MILAATGLKREASLIVSPGLCVVVSGGVPEALRGRLETAINRGGKVPGVISVGLGGALSPDLAVGDWVVGERVIDGEAVWKTDAIWDSPYR